MPSFVPNGPILPNDLLRDLEDDRVVIFCGAGVSMSAGLPSYGGLVEQVYQEMGFNPPEKMDSRWDWPDRLLGDLEIISLPGMVRTEVVAALDKQASNLDFHKALLRLAQLNRHPGLRLITTNFDTFFEAADPSLRLGYNLHSGPILPIPRDDRSGSWQSLVHLHGRLEPPPHPNDHLIMTSADFGRAYLTEGWAARFVTQLFENFTVLFVGYSLKDPVLRYMTDAFGAATLAARRRSLRQPAFIFVPYKTQDKTKLPSLSDEFRNRGLEPVFYPEDHPNYPDHQVLRDTLIKWASIRDDWSSYVKELVTELAHSEPETLQSERESNLLWALFGRIDDDGYGVKLFAELDPAPPISWLQKIESREACLEIDHIKRIEVARLYGENKPFRLVLQLRQLTVLPDESPSLVTNAAYYLACWLVRHLNEIALIDWVTGHTQVGHRLHPSFRALIRKRLFRKDVSLSHSQHLFWYIVSSEGAWTGESGEPNRGLGLHFKKIDSVEVARVKLLELLQPYIRLSRATRVRNDQRSMFSTKQMLTLDDCFSHIAKADVDLIGGNSLQMALEDFYERPNADAQIGELTDDMTSLLKAALDLWAVVGEANSVHDPGEHDLPSIPPHRSNRHSNWTTLVELLWQGWMYVNQCSIAVSRRIIDRWLSIAYPTFQRLALQAIKQSSFCPSNEKLRYLLKTEGYLPLWSEPLKKEAMELMSAIWKFLDQIGRERLLDAIMAGPPQETDETKQEPDAPHQHRRDRMIFERLKIIDNIQEPPLCLIGQSKLLALTLAYPAWATETAGKAVSLDSARNAQISKTDDGVEDLKNLSGAALRSALREPGPDRDHRLEYWSRVVQEYPDRGIGLLNSLLSDIEEQDELIWQETLYGLYGYSEANIKPFLASQIAEILYRTPKYVVKNFQLSLQASEFLNVISRMKIQPLQEAVFWHLWDQLIEITLADDDTLPPDDKWMSQAIYHPIGMLTNSLLEMIIRSRTKIGEGFTPIIVDRLERLTQPNPRKLRLARAILVSHLNYLFAVDPAWVSKSLIPYLSWSNSEIEAATLWSGYVWKHISKNEWISADLWTTFCDHFLETLQSERLSRLCTGAQSLVCLLMRVGIELPEIAVPSVQTRNIIRSMSPQNREAAVCWLHEYLAGHYAENLPIVAGKEHISRADRLWSERVSPWITRAWPRDAALMEPGTSKCFARVAIATDQEFNQAVRKLLPYIGPTREWTFAVKDLYESKHPDKHPEATLMLIDRLAVTQRPSDVKYLQDVLSRLIEAKAKLRYHSAFRRLNEWLLKGWL